MEPAVARARPSFSNFCSIRRPRRQRRNESRGSVNSLSINNQPSSINCLRFWLAHWADSSSVSPRSGPVRSL